MNIDHHISQLLYHHDCVIVPGFGGFVTNFQPSRIHPVQHQFFPPSKSLGFNIHLKRNDGLLANNISTIEVVSYDEALKLITEFVNRCNENLNERQSCMVDKVGRLYFDVEKNLRFEVDTANNYLLDSFGLTTIQSPPIKRDTLTEKIEKTVKNREPLKPVRTGDKKKFPWKTALILPVIGLFVWASVQTINVYHRSDTGNLNPFSNTTAPKNEIIKETPPVYIPEEPIPAEIEASPEENNVEIVPEEILVEPEKIETEKEITRSEIIIPLLEKKYFVIAGAFAVPENAEKLILQLKEKGFAYAAIIDTTRQGLHVVSYNEGFSAYSEALQNLNTLRSEENSAAWLLKK